jgi:mono/diheme cytochrome c family protein
MNHWRIAVLAAVAPYLGAQASPGRPPRPPGGGAGADDKHVVDAAAADRGRKIYAAECIHCHGTHARGTERGADLIRSVLVLRDRYGNKIGPYLRKGHPTQTTPPAQFSPAQIQDLSHYVHHEVYQTLRSALEIQDVLTGDPKAGAEYFNGAGKCHTCHSPTGDLAGIGKRYDPPTLQQRFLFPRSTGFSRRRFGAGPPSKPVTVVVTPPNGPVVSGVLVHLDDFNVSLRDSLGEYHSWKRTPQLQVVKNDPYAAHLELLDQYTDRNMHDIVAYLETLK